MTATNLEFERALLLRGDSSPEPMTAHAFLTDQGCYVHTHIDADFDDGDAENGPGDTGNPPYDLYEGDSHDLILERGLLVW